MRIALGLSDYLDDFAGTCSAETWKHFAKNDPTQWKLRFLAVMNDEGTQVFFNLKGVDVWAGVMRAASGRHGATDWELLQIKQNKDWWPRIKWCKDGLPLANPFE
ncbi:MAG TPA: hypothetical protein VIK18_10400 [Pirellulales bacterium]